MLNRRYGAAEDQKLEEIDPPVLEPGHVIVRVRAASVNAGDWRLMRGWPRVARPMMGGFRGADPPVRGWDLAGVVESVADDVETLHPGDEVFGAGAGTFAELATAPAGRLALKPPWLSFEDAGAIGVAAVTALQALRDRVHVQPGHRVLVTGAGGGVGTYAVQIAKAYGAEVTGVCSAAKVELVRQLGADRVIDYAVEDFTRDRRRYDVIFDIAGGRSLHATRRALADDGALCRHRWEGKHPRTDRARRQGGSPETARAAAAADAVPRAGDDGRLARTGGDDRSGDDPRSGRPDVPAYRDGRRDSVRRGRARARQGGRRRLRSRLA